MNFKNVLACISVGAIFLSQSVFADSTIVYKNQRGSVLSLIWHTSSKNTGTLSGTFTTAVGNCKEDVGVALPVTGYFNGNAISITVNFPHCKQVVAMTGNLSKNQSRLYTLWLDANQAEDPRVNDWNSNIVGSDSYEKIG